MVLNVYTTTEVPLTCLHRKRLRSTKQNKRVYTFKPLTDTYVSQSLRTAQRNAQNII